MNIGAVFDTAVGFGLEALAFFFWLSLGVLLRLLLITRMKWVKGNDWACSIIAGGIVLALIGDYRAFLFWTLMFVVFIMVTASPFVEIITARFTWMRSLTYYAICAAIVISVFIMMRAVMFQDIPHQMWYQ